MSDREELAALRRMAELEARAGGNTPESRGIDPAEVMKKAAPYYLGPAGPARGASELLHWLDRIAYKGGEFVNDQANKVLPAEAAAGLGVATNLGIQTLPMMLGGSLAKTLFSSPMESAARNLMQSALKPTLKTLQSGDAAKAIDTMLKNGFNATPGGVAAIKDKIGVLNDDITKSIANSTAVVDKNAVASRLGDALKKFEMQVNPSADVKTIERAWTEFLNHPLLGDKIPVQTAQELKKGTYRALSDKAYGELKGADIEAQKALARGLKEEIASAVPGVAGLNAEESALLNARKVAERRVLMDANKNPLGLGSLNPHTLMLWLADRSSLFKSLAARALYSGSEVVPNTFGMAAGATLGSRLGMPPDEQQTSDGILRRSGILQTR